MMTLSSADIAGATAQQAQASVEDLRVQVQWLMQEVKRLSDAAGVEMAPMPELPSARKQRMIREVYEQARQYYPSDMQRTGLRWGRE